MKNSKDTELKSMQDNNQFYDLEASTSNLMPTNKPQTKTSEERLQEWYAWKEMRLAKATVNTEQIRKSRKVLMNYQGK